MTEIVHGTAASYNNHACRCEDCREAIRSYHAERRKERYAKRVLVNGQLIAPLPDERHGKASTYANHGCRCRECVRARSDHDAEYLNGRRTKLRDVA